MDSVNQIRISQVPSFARQKTYNFDNTKDTFDVYKELTEISEEIEACRLRNC